MKLSQKIERKPLATFKTFDKVSLHVDIAIFETPKVIRQKLKNKFGSCNSVDSETVSECSIRMLLEQVKTQAYPNSSSIF